MEERREGLVTEGGRVTSESEKIRRKRRHKRTDKSWGGEKMTTKVQIKLQ